MDLEAVRARREAAHRCIVDLCSDPSAKWRMSIPAQPDRDPDLVITASLTDVDDLLSEVDRLRAALAEVLAEFTMAGLVDDVEALRTPMLPASRVDGWHRALEAQPETQRPQATGEETTT